MSNPCRPPLMTWSRLGVKAPGARFGGNQMQVYGCVRMCVGLGCVSGMCVSECVWGAWVCVYVRCVCMCVRACVREAGARGEHCPFEVRSPVHLFFLPYLPLSFHSPYF